VTGFAGFLGLTESRPLGKIENRKLGGAEDRLPEGSPQGELSAATSQFRGFFDKINIINKIEIRRAGAFVERMWLSKKKTSASELASISLF